VAKVSELRVHADSDELTRAAADELTRAAESAVRERDRFTIALAGGSTPKRLYQLLANGHEPFRARLPWAKSHFFWGDERHVPPDHPKSNYRMAREAMLDAVPVPPGNVHRIEAENPDAAAAAARYEEDLRAFFHLAHLAHLADAELPRFDLVLLGLGADGHTASLFPGSAAVHEAERLVIAPWVEAQKSFRITLTPPVLNAAAVVLFLVSGEEKAAVLAAMFEEDRAGGSKSNRDVDRYPAQIVRPVAGKLLWMVDRTAARELTSTA
jgi:6-phosphogluconolactonase